MRAIQYAIIIVVMLFLSSCIIFDSFIIEIDSDDETAPDIMFTVSGAATPTLGERYQVFLFRDRLAISNLAQDQQSGIQEATIEVQLDIVCQPVSGGAFSYNPPVQRETYLPRDDGRVLTLGASSTRLEFEDIRARFCGAEQIDSFTGRIIATATNFAGLRSSATLEVFALPCGRLGEPCCGTNCSRDSDCRDGFCSVPCTTGSSCTLPDALGACRIGTRSCGVLEATCTPSEPKEEICNGVDDDCNGLVDDGIDTIITDFHPPECHDGFTVQRETRCEDGEEVSIVSTYCNRVGGNCGNGPTTRCNEFTGTDSCRPGYACQRTGDGIEVCELNRSCELLPPRNACWLPEDVGKLCWTP